METHGRLHFSGIRGGAKPLPPNMGHFFLRGKENTKRAGNGPFNPEKYGMTICTGCNGSGKSTNGLEEMSVCGACGGFGLTKKQ